MVLLVALLVVTAASLGLIAGAWLAGKGPSPTMATPGPQADITVLATNASGAQQPVVGANVTLFSVVPLALDQSVVGWNLSQFDPWSNPAYVELGSGETGSEGVAHIVLAPTFAAIVDEWRSVALPPTRDVSLQADASYALTSGSNASYYHDFAELDFSPLTEPAGLNLTMVGNLTAPAWTGSLPAEAEAASTSGCTSASTADWTPESFSTESGALPVAALIDGPGAAGSDPLLVSDEWGNFGDVQIGLGGIEAQVPGPIEASIEPSWSGVYSDFGLEEAPSEAGPGTGTNGSTWIAEVYLSGVAFVVVNMLEVFHWEAAGGCSEQTLRFQYVTAWVAQATTLIPTCQVNFCTELFESRELSLGPTTFLGGVQGRELANQSVLAPGNPVDGSSLIPGWTGYARAMELAGQALGTSFVFSSDLGEAMVLSILAAECDYNCSANLTGELLDQASAQFGPAFGEIPSFAAVVSVWATNVTSDSVVQDTQYTNYIEGAGDSVELFEYVGTEPTHVDLGGTNVAFNAPELGPWACPVGASPGTGC